MSSVLVIAGYRFVDLDDGPALRSRLHHDALHADLKGTVLIAPEGINLSLAGAPTVVDTWLAALQQDPRFAALTVHRHHTPAVPFKRLRVKLKPEIIRMDQPVVRPRDHRAPAVDAATLQHWLDRGHCDAGRPVVMLDTRNAFEVDAGAFSGAIDWRLSRFSDFPAALAAHRDSLQDKTVVSYCTGGIRCEKAALWMQAQGIDAVWQLDGGIHAWLRHTSRNGDLTCEAPASPAISEAHWRGRCFVFDERVSVV
ncbi:MAG: rhodanese-like domain-containing protein [Rubrivivax sp.]